MSTKTPLKSTPFVLKAPAPMVSTDAGRLTDLRNILPENAFLPMLFTVFGIETFLSINIAAKALLPICVMPSLIIISVIFLPAQGKLRLSHIAPLPDRVRVFWLALYFASILSPHCCTSSSANTTAFAPNTALIIINTDKVSDKNLFIKSSLLKKLVHPLYKIRR